MTRLGPTDKTALQPDDRREDYVTFYDQIAAAQLEENYYGSEHADALARYHLLMGLLKPLARDGRHLLDIGCASGHYSIPYAVAGGRVTGLDVAEAGVRLFGERAREAGVADRADARAGDVRELPFENASFDVVFMSEVIEHVREQHEALAEVSRVLRPGGTLVLTTPHAFEQLSTLGRLRRLRAATPEAGGVAVERLGVSDTVASAGIAHAPYFHDAFTFAQITELSGPRLEVVRLHSLWFTPPRWAMEAAGRALATLRRAPASPGGPAAPAAAANPSERALVEVPPPDLGTRALIAWTRLVWRLPLLRGAGHGILLVARRSA